MEDDKVCIVKKRAKYSIVFAIFMLAGMIIFILALLSFTKAFNSSKKKQQAEAVKKAESQEQAKHNLDILLGDKYKGLVVTANDGQQYYEILVDKEVWKTLKIKQKKKLLDDISNARKRLGLNYNIKIIDAKTGAEYGSFENDRISLVELDL
ncbi:hypothetical protein MCHI_001158 [Candidatus Magnetoovum chiemensis]|nr:hypothetical protein MCHI_001158 [Candidatus Magnetoovum chiemensis]